MDHNDIYNFDNLNSSLAQSLEGGYENSYTSYSRSGKTAAGVLTASVDPRKPSYRPKTSANRGAGYTSAGVDGRKTSLGTRMGPVTGAMFDPLRMAGVIRDSQVKTVEQEARQQVKKLELQILKLVDDSASLQAKGNLALALEKAKEAGRKERSLSKLREQAGLDSSSANMDVTYSCLFNLANQYQASQLYDDALDLFSLLVKNKQFKYSIRLRVSMGNIYFAQGNYKQAIKMYRMVLDNFAIEGADGNQEFPFMRTKVLENIGNSFIRLSQFQEALNVYEEIWQSEYVTPLNGCYYLICALIVGNIELMQVGFEKLVALSPAVVIDASASQLDAAGLHTNSEMTADNIDDGEIFNEDALRNTHRIREQEAERIVLLSARIAAAHVGSTLDEGFAWVCEVLRGSASQYKHLSNKLEIVMTLQYLQQGEYDKALTRLKEFELKDEKLAGTAAVNLSFLSLLQGDIESAKKYAETAVAANLYSGAARTNLGNCFFLQAEKTGQFELFETAKQCFYDAMNQESVCIEAMYNCGLTLKKQGKFEEAILLFKRLHDIVKTSPEVLYQLAETSELDGSVTQAKEYYDMLHTLVPTDPNVLAAIGNWFLSYESDTVHARQKALHYYSESHRYYPAEISVVGWLALHHFENKDYDQSVGFYRKAAVVEPNVVYWRIQIANCLLKLGRAEEALACCREAYALFPVSVPNLEKLVEVCAKLNMSDAVAEYNQAIQRLASQSAGQVSPLQFSNYKPFSPKFLGKRHPSEASGKTTLVKSKPKPFLPPETSAAPVPSQVLSKNIPNLAINLNDLLPE